MSDVTALAIVAHGSPREQANAPIYQIAEAIRSRAIYDRVEVGFLDRSRPTIPETLDLCAAAGAVRIVVVPYFLHPGTHVLRDIPDLLDGWRAIHPRVEVLLGRHIGEMPEVTAVMAARAEEAAAR